MRRTYLSIVLALVLLCAALAVAPARAADTRGGDQLVIGREEVIAGDLYVGAQSLTLDGTVKGDLVVAAGQVLINGTVEGDLLAVAQSVVVNGTVSDDVRAGAQAVMLGPNARVGGDLAVGGASLETHAGSQVQGDLLAGAFQALLAGEIGRNVSGGMSRAELRGTVGGDVDLAVGGDDGGAAAVQMSPPPQVALPSVQPGLTIANSARIGGKLIYQSSDEATIGTGAQVAGGVAFSRTPAAQASQPSTTLPGLSYLQRLIALLLVGALLLWLAPRWTQRLADTVEQRPLPSLGWGLLAAGAAFALVVGILIISIALAVLFGYLTLGGLSALAVVVGLLVNSALVVSLIVFAAYVAEIVVALMAGHWLLGRVQPSWAERPLAALALGLVLYVALRAIPVFGGLLALAVGLLALGALWQWGRAIYERRRPTPAPTLGVQPV